MQREQTQWILLPMGIWLMFYPRKWEKKQGKSLCMRNVVHVNSLEEDKRLRTLLDFEATYTYEITYCPQSLT